MKTISSHVFGELTIDEASIITFPQGLYGFEWVKQFVLVGDHDDDMPFQWLHAIDEQLCFVVIDPREIEENYDIDIPDQQLAIIKANEKTTFMALCIVVVPDKIEEMTANLRSPVIINLDKQLGIQVVLENVPYLIKQPVIQSVEG